MNYVSASMNLSRMNPIINLGEWHLKEISCQSKFPKLSQIDDKIDQLYTH